MKSPGWLAIVVISLLSLQACAQELPKGPAQVAGMTNPPPGSASFAGANFWNIDWQGQDEYFRKGVNFATDTNPWRPELLADLQPYRVLRFMDWNEANGAQSTQAHFDTRKQKTAAQNEPVALEWQIDLCNRTDKDCWITVHHTSTPDDWRRMAELIKGSLKPTLRFYLELSNEVWNGGFPQNEYARNAAREQGLPGANPAAAWYVYSSVRMFEEFARVYAGQDHRLIKVLSGQAGWTGPCEAHVEALGNDRINPHRTLPDVYAIAPYFGGETIDALRGSLAEVRKMTEAHVKCAQRIGAPLIAYEGGSDSFALRDKCVNLQGDPGMRQLYKEYLDTLTAAGLRGPFMQYTHSGSCWGLKVRSGDPLEASPKYQGLLDWMQRLPPAKVP